MKKTADSATRPAGRPRSRIGEASTRTPAANTAASAAQVEAGGGSTARTVSEANVAARPASATGNSNGRTRRNDVRAWSWTFTCLLPRRRRSQSAAQEAAADHPDE